VSAQPPAKKDGRSDQKSNIRVHRGVRSLRPIGLGLRPGRRTPRKKILNNLCDLRVLCGEIFLEKGIGYYEVSNEPRRWPEKFTRLGRAASLIEIETFGARF
jgi:hypothetical protein